VKTIHQRLFDVIPNEERICYVEQLLNGFGWDKFEFKKFFWRYFRATWRSNLSI